MDRDRAADDRRCYVDALPLLEAALPLLPEGEVVKHDSTTLYDLMAAIEVSPLSTVILSLTEVPAKSAPQGPGSPNRLVSQQSGQSRTFS
jgi:hypothetical protein